MAERSIDRSELYAAEEVFECGTGAQVAPSTGLSRLPGFTLYMVTIIEI